MRSYLVFFDLDHTLLSTSSSSLFIGYSCTHGHITFPQLVKFLFYLALYRLNILDRAAIISIWAASYQGRSVRELAGWAEKWFRESVIQHIRPEAVEVIRKHRLKGGRVVLLSAASTFLCRPVVRHLKLDGLVCTRLETKRKRLTGHLSGGYCYGEEKLRRAAAYCRACGFDLAESCYYGDSRSDIPVLERVGHPVCVNPGRRLKEFALRKGWSIVRWR